MREKKQTTLEQAKAMLKHNAQKPKAGGSPRKRGMLASNFTEARQERYFAVLRETGEHEHAREEVGITAGAIHRTRKKNADFAEAEQEALRVYRATVGLEIHRRGVEGVQEPIFFNGVIVGWITRYSDQLLALHAKRHIPEYGDRVTVDNQHSGTLDLMTVLGELPPELRQALRPILEKLKDKEDESE